MAHLELKAGIFVPLPGTSMQYFQDNNGKCRSENDQLGRETFPILTLSEELRRQYKLINFTAELEAFRPPLPSGVEFLHELAQSIRHHTDAR